jgi:hypothetical protein
MRVSVVLIIRRCPKIKIKLVDIGGPVRKCAYHAFIIQNLGVVILELGIKVQFTNF